jgi:hypothetical protein
MLGGRPSNTRISMMAPHEEKKREDQQIVGKQKYDHLVCQDEVRAKP